MSGIFRIFGITVIVAFPIPLHEEAAWHQQSGHRLDCCRVVVEDYVDDVYDDIPPSPGEPPRPEDIPDLLLVVDQETGGIVKLAWEFSTVPAFLQVASFSIYRSAATMAGAPNELQKKKVVKCMELYRFLLKHVMMLNTYLQSRQLFLIRHQK